MGLRLRSQTWTPGAAALLVLLGCLGVPSALAALPNLPNPGGAPLPPATVQIQRDMNSATVQVASDGFFVMNASGPVVLVQVTSQSGEVISGTLQNLTPSYTATPILGWSANEPLVLGTKYEANVQIQGPGLVATDQAELEVVGPPTELSESTPSFGAWIDFRHGVGAQTTCKSRYDATYTFTLSSSEEARRGVRMEWTPPSPIVGRVAWEAYVELPERAPAPTPLLPHPVYTTQLAPVSLGTLVFPADASEFCAVLVVRDVRRGTELRSQQCGEPGPSVATERDYPLASCAGPPSAELYDAWCELYASDPQCAVPYDPNTAHPPAPQPLPPAPSGAAGSAAAGSAGAAGTPPVRTTAHHSDDFGCQLARGPARGSAWALLLAAALLGWRRRLAPAQT